MDGQVVAQCAVKTAVDGVGDLLLPEGQDVAGQFLLKIR